MRTQIRSSQIKDVQRNDIDTITPGQALITSISLGETLTMDYTGIDPGTGDVTLNVNVNALNTAQKYLHVQSAQSTSWLVQHDMDCYPKVLILDSNGLMVQADIIYTNKNLITIQFTEPISGQAHLTQ